jgi:hypothetical protein
LKSISPEEDAVEPFDSRALAYTDCYVRRFERQGPVSFRMVSSVLPSIAVAGGAAFEAAATVTDDEEEAEGFEVGGEDAPEALAAEQAQQHHVAARLSGRRIRSAEAIGPRIRPGDLVSWAAADPRTPRFVVEGRDAEGAFSSATLTSGSVYSHPFGIAGVHQWTDAIGGTVGGEVVVRDPAGATPDDLRQWMASLREATLVTIDAGRVEPERVEILTAQTVIWAVYNTDAPGVTITSTALLEAGAVQADGGDPIRTAK